MPAVKAGEDHKAGCRPRHEPGGIRTGFRGAPHAPPPDGEHPVSGQPRRSRSAPAMVDNENIDNTDNDENETGGRKRKGLFGTRRVVRKSPPAFADASAARQDP